MTQNPLMDSTQGGVGLWVGEEMVCDGVGVGVCAAGGVAVGVDEVGAVDGVAVELVDVAGVPGAVAGPVVVAELVFVLEGATAA